MSCFTDALLAIVRKHGERAAVEWGGRSLTYGELYGRALGVAEALRGRGAGAETVVALAMEKSGDYVIALLGCWLAGAAFLPLDSGMPEERLRFQLRDSGAGWVVGRRADLQRLAGEGAEPLVWEEMPAQAEPGFVPVGPSPSSLAYVIYTSGSSGVPKGVLVEHRGLLPVLGTQIEAFGLRPGSRSLFLLSHLFDASLSDIGTALLSGATLCIPPGSPLDSVADLPGLLGRQRITHADLPPSVLPLLSPELLPESMETVIIGGEPCDPAVVRRWAQRLRVVNVYGPTEATICCSLCACGAETWSRPLVGSPVSEASLSVRSGEGEPCPVGTAGEIWIGGTIVARGYRNRLELEAARFVERDGQRFYRTGDRGIERRKGEIEFLGRIDRQLKIGGKLVIPEEIELNLCRYPLIEHAAVVPRTTRSGRDGLVAFYTGPVDVPVASLRAFLSPLLPDWMIPVRFVRLARLPVLSSGKIDLEALREMPLPDPGAGAAPPLAGEEQALAEIWARVLGVEAFGPEDDFFELGGDSLALLRAAAEAEVSGLRVSPGQMAKARTIRATLRERDHAVRGDARSADELRCDVQPDRTEIERASTLSSTDATCTHAGAAVGDRGARRILVTGATGFLGSRLVAELLKQTLAELVCLVRARDVPEAGARLREALASQLGRGFAADLSRVTAIPGDVGRRRLRMPARRWEELSLTIDAIYHCAAEVHLARSYEEMRDTNVGGVREMLCLAAAGKPKHLHYASTLSVFVATDRNRGRMSEDDDLSGTGWVYGGYAQTKWAAERLVREAECYTGPVSIYRFGLITGDSATGAGVPRDLLGRFFRGIARLGAVPESAAELRVDVTPIDYAAAAMARLSLGETESGTFHIAGSQGASVAELVGAMREEGVAVEWLPEDKWPRRLQEALGRHDDPEISVAALALCRCLPGLGAFERGRTVDLFQATGTEWGMERARAGLEGTGIECPPVTRALLRSYVRDAVRHEAGGAV